MLGVQLTIAVVVLKFWEVLFAWSKIQIFHYLQVVDSCVHLANFELKMIVMDGLCDFMEH